MHNEMTKINFTMRYVLGMILLAILSSGAFFILNIAVKTAESTALIVNMSSNQRMLSQRVALLSHNYLLHIHQNNSSDAIRTKQSLIDAITDMKDVNERLSSGIINKTVTVKLSPELHNLYFGSMNLKRRIDAYLELVNHVLLNQHNNPNKDRLFELTTISDTLLPDINQVILQYQKEGEESISGIKNLVLIVWIMTFFVLLMEVIFIFQPMSNKFREFFQKEIWNKHNFQQEIKIRTHSLEQANEKLKYTASHDPLTGLNNRLNLEHELEKILLHYQYNHIPFAVLMLDIDWFKKVNDNYGHDVGDFVLTELSDLIRESIRSEDSAYRVGGEEFVVVLNRISESMAIEKSQAIRKIVEAHPFIFGKYNFKVTISGGLYHPELLKASDIHGVMKLADNALYTAKNEGRNRIVLAQSFIEPPMMSDPTTVTLIQARGIRCETILFTDFDIVDILGYSNDMLTSGVITLQDIVHPDDQDWFDRLALRKSFMTTLRIFHAHGNIKIVKVTSTPSENELWKLEIQDPLRLAQTVEDKTILQNFEAIMDKAEDFIYFKDRYHVFTAGSRSLVNLTTVPTNEILIGKTDYEVFPREFADKFFKLEKEIFTGEIEVSHEIQPFLDNHGNDGWVDNRKYPIKNNDGEIVGLLCIARIVTDLNLLYQSKS